MSSNIAAVKRTGAFHGAKIWRGCPTGSVGHHELPPLSLRVGELRGAPRSSFQLAPSRSRGGSTLAGDVVFGDETRPARRVRRPAAVILRADSRAYSRRKALPNACADRRIVGAAFGFPPPGANGRFSPRAGSRSDSEPLRFSRAFSVEPCICDGRELLRLIFLCEILKARSPLGESSSLC